jgi:DHA2 family multidrug resistance protein-like MFS transporter
MTTNNAPPKAGRREWLGLTMLVLPTFVVAIDLFVLMLALPKLSADLGADSNQQLWVMDIYGFMLAGFLITMGTLGDRIGRRKLLLIGAATFAAASLLCAYSTSPGMLIAARALLGIAGATLGPSTLALIGTLFQDPRQQAKAFGIWGSTFTLGALLGPVIGGAMLAKFWWGSVFLLGVPVMVLVVVLGPKLLPEYRNERAGRLDPPSVVLSLATLLPVIYGIKELAANGWAPVPVLAIVIGVVAAVTFVRRQRVLSNPLLDLSLFHNRVIRTSLTGQLLYSLTGGGIMLLTMLHFQLLEGMSTLEAGLAMVPGMAGGALGFTVAPKLANRFRPGYIIAGGLALAAVVLAIYTQIDGDQATPYLIVGFFFTAFLGAPMAGLGVTLSVGSAPPEKMGTAGSLAQMANEFGGTLGIALLGTVGAAVYRGQIADNLPPGLPADAEAAARDSIAGATSAAGGLPGQLGQELLAPAHAAFTSGLHTVAAIGAIVMLCGAVLTGTRLKHVPPIGQPAPGPDEGTTDESPAATREKVLD